MLKIYGMHQCPHCEAAEVYLREQGIPYEYVDISSETANLKEFLKIRDAEEELFAPVREAGNIGIPCFVLGNGEITLDREKIKGS